jgi:hypothetical protein
MKTKGVIMNIPIHPKDETFVKLMRDVNKAIRKKDKKILERAKKKFAKADIQLFYNKENDTVRVLKKNAPPIDFPLSNWN